MSNARTTLGLAINRTAFDLLNQHKDDLIGLLRRARDQDHPLRRREDIWRRIEAVAFFHEAKRSPALAPGGRPRSYAWKDAEDIAESLESARSNLLAATAAVSPKGFVSDVHGNLRRAWCEQRSMSLPDDFQFEIGPRGKLVIEFRDNGAYAEFDQSLKALLYDMAAMASSARKAVSLIKGPKHRERDTAALDDVDIVAQIYEWATGRKATTTAPYSMRETTADKRIGQANNFADFMVMLYRDALGIETSDHTIHARIKKWHSRTPTC